jgi:transposase InsO family protein
MTMATKHDVLKDHLDEWLQAKNDKKKRGEIVKTVCAAIRINPKSVPRAFRRIQLRGVDSAPRPGRPVIYTPDVIAALCDVWEAGNMSCGELLHPVIPEYVRVMKRDGDWKHSETATEKLLAMSIRTMKRRVLALQKKHGIRRGISSTRPSSLKSIIPVFKGPWKDIPLGTGQVDTVAHCGNTLLGDFIFSVNFVDAATYWTVPRAQWNKGQAATIASIEAIRKRLPFSLKGLHPDSGGEFINWNLKEWCEREKVDLSRSEPGKKNDNMFIEERNGHVIRRYLGYRRFDEPAVVAAINELYETLGLYLNHFKAVRRQTSKDKVGSKYVRKYERMAMTPYQRVLGREDVSEETKDRLREEHEKLNPLRLKKRIDTLILKINNIQNATRGIEK